MKFQDLGTFSPQFPGPASSKWPKLITQMEVPFSPLKGSLKTPKKVTQKTSFDDIHKTPWDVIKIHKALGFSQQFEKGDSFLQRWIFLPNMNMIGFLKLDWLGLRFFSFVCLISDMF